MWKEEFGFFSDTGKIIVLWRNINLDPYFTLYTETTFHWLKVSLKVQNYEAKWIWRHMLIILALRRLRWGGYWFTGQPGLYRKTLSQKKKKKEREIMKLIEENISLTNIYVVIDTLCCPVYVWSGMFTDIMLHGLHILEYSSPEKILYKSMKDAIK
jgi:hypothetical protein